MRGCVLEVSTQSILVVIGILGRVRPVHALSEAAVMTAPAVIGFRGGRSPDYPMRGVSTGAAVAAAVHWNCSWSATICKSATVSLKIDRNVSCRKWKSCFRSEPPNPQMMRRRFTGKKRQVPHPAIGYIMSPKSKAKSLLFLQAS